MTKNKIFLIRHGQTAWSLEGKHTGLTDIPLLPEGRAQAETLRGRLQGCAFQKILTSPLQRARETCLLAGMGAQAVVDPDLVEWDYGQFEGLTSAQIRQMQPHWDLFTQGAPGGESPTDIGARASRVLSKLHNLHGDVVLFSSAHFLRVLATKWLNLPISEGKKLFLSPASVSILGFEHTTPALLLWNSSGPLVF